MRDNIIRRKGTVFSDQKKHLKRPSQTSPGEKKPRGRRFLFWPSGFPFRVSGLARASEVGRRLRRQSSVEVLFYYILPYSVLGNDNDTYSGPTHKCQVFRWLLQKMKARSGEPSGIFRLLHGSLPTKTITRFGHSARMFLPVSVTYRKFRNLLHTPLSLPLAQLFIYFFFYINSSIQCIPL
jgi:hypothetical protein